MKYYFYFVIALALFVCGCQSTPESGNSAFDNSSAELSSSDDSTLSSNDSFTLEDNGAPLNFPGGSATYSSSSFADEVDSQVLNGSSNDLPFIDPSAPAIDSNSAFIPSGRPGSDGFTPLQPSYRYVGNTPSYTSSYNTYIPPSPTYPSSYITPVGKGGTYTVKSGDSLWKIARANGCTVKALAEANGISENGILPIGKKLKIPGGSSSSSASYGQVSGDTYTVKPGDSYYKIGKKLKINYIKLMNANGGSDKLTPGQVIKLP